MKSRWYKDAVVYQIYPRSFCDSNGDGIGDIKGITSKLDYLKDLGINAVWLSPIYNSPNDDNGYDISDYRSILSDFGTMDDFNEMIAEMHKRGIRLIMDLVANHSSDEHYWFQESKKSLNNPYRDYYIWKKGKGKNGKKPPNNWTSRLTGSAWEYDETTKEWYLHLFSKKQPDLNWDNPAVRQEVIDICDYWFALGVDGFRCDVISYISKTDYHNGKNHIALRGDDKFVLGKNIHAYLKEMNEKCWSNYDSLIVGEAPGVSLLDAPLLVKEGLAELDSIISFDHTLVDVLPFGLSVYKFKHILSRWQQLPEDCWNTLYYENHDRGRSVTRYANGKKSKNQDYLAKMLAVSLHFLKGTSYVYQGQELGMTNCPLSTNEYKDIFSIKALSATKHIPIVKTIAKRTLDRIGRDHARTPMQWSSKNEFAGFSDSATWMKVNPNYQTINVESESNDENSVLAFYKKIIKFKIGNELLVKGTYREYYPDSKYLFVYERQYENKSYFVICNFKNRKIFFSIPSRLNYSNSKIIFSNYNRTGELEIESYLSPYETIVLELDKIVQ